MKLLFDTTVVIAGSVEGHKNHRRCSDLMQTVAGGEHAGFVSSHTLVEFYRYLTGVLRPQMKPEGARQAVQYVTDGFGVVCLGFVETVDVLDRVARLKLSGAIVYDAIIAQAGLVAGVDRILTLNKRDFERLGHDVAEILEVP